MRVISNVESKNVSGGDINIREDGSFTASGGVHGNIYAPGSPERLGGVAATGWTDDGASWTEYTDGSKLVTDPNGVTHSWDPEAKKWG